MSGTALGLDFSPSYTRKDGLKGLTPVLTVMDLKVPLSGAPFDALRANFPTVLGGLFKSIATSKGLKNFFKEQFMDLLTDKAIFGGFFMGEELDDSEDAFMEEAKAVYDYYTCLSHYLPLVQTPAQFHPQSHSPSSATQ